MKKKSVTIGISAYNEQATIKNLLDSIDSQDQNLYRLEKIIVVCDGCTDRTAGIVKKLQFKNKLIHVIDDGKRLGKAARLNAIYKNNKSDIILILDADVELAHKNVIDEIVKKFDSEEVGLVGGYNIPFPARNYFEKIMVTWLEIWQDIRTNTNRGISIHNHLGCISALSKSLARQIVIPNNTMPDDDFVYMSAKKLGYKFRFAINAVVYYRTVNNFRDFTVQHSRLLHSKEGIIEYFGGHSRRAYKTNESRKAIAIGKTFLKKPILTILAIGLQIMLRNGIFVQKEEYHNGFWKVARSSKILA